MAKIGKIAHNSGLETMLSFASMFHRKTTFPSFFDIVLELGAWVLANAMWTQGMYQFWGKPVCPLYLSSLLSQQFCKLWHYHDTDRGITLNEQMNQSVCLPNWKCVTKIQTFGVLCHRNFWVYYLRIDYLILTNTKHDKITKLHLTLKFYILSFCLFPSSLFLTYTFFFWHSNFKVLSKLISLCFALLTIPVFRSGIYFNDGCSSG